ncbi:hypothetical protein RSAG8_08408, partial [Rhizoctonia solani AG-8 WAC10335]
MGPIRFVCEGTEAPYHNLQGQLAGEYGLCNKHEIWRILLVPGCVVPVVSCSSSRPRSVSSKLRTAAYGLLAIQTALIRSLVRIGVLDENRVGPYCVLALKSEEFLDGRLPTQVFKSGFVEFTHHACVLTRQRHVHVSKQIMNVLSFVVHLDSRKHMDSAGTSLYAGGPRDMYTASALPLPPTNMRLERVGTRGSRYDRLVLSFSNAREMAVCCIHRATSYARCTDS